MATLLNQNMLRVFIKKKSDSDLIMLLDIEKALSINKPFIIDKLNEEKRLVVLEDKGHLESIEEMTANMQ